MRRIDHRNPERPATRIVGRSFFLLSVAAACGPLATAQFPPTESVDSRPAATTLPAGYQRFQPGVSINWTKRRVRVAGHVVLRNGPLEYLACLAGKEHESIVRIDATAAHVYLALGLIGLTPGAPARWDAERGAFTPPSGDLVDVSFEWFVGARRLRSPASAWLRETQYERTPFERAWVFAGSVKLEDGSLAADRTGSGVALVNAGASLLALSQAHTDRDAELWIEANTKAIPPADTPVALLFERAQPRPLSVRVDHRGDVYVNGRYADLADLADLLRLNRVAQPGRMQQITVDGALQSDVARIKRRLSENGLLPDAIRWKVAAPAGIATP